MGSGTWVLVSKIFPNRMRAQGMSIAVGCMWLANFVVSQTFLMINDNPYLFSNFHGAFPMWVFAVCCLFSYWFISRYIPETKSISLEKNGRYSDGQTLSPAATRNTTNASVSKSATLRFSHII